MMESAENALEQVPLGESAEMTERMSKREHSDEEVSAASERARVGELEREIVRLCNRVLAAERRNAELARQISALLMLIDLPEEEWVP